MEEQNTIILRGFADNELLSAAVKQVLLKQFSWDEIEPDESSEVVGHAVKARLFGRRAVEEAFKEIARYKTIKKEPESINPAR